MKGGDGRTEGGGPGRSPEPGGVLGAAPAPLQSSASSLRWGAAPHTRGWETGRVGQGVPVLSPPLLRHCRSPLPHTVPTGGLDPPLAPSPAPLGCGRAGLCSVWREALSSARGWAPTVRPCGEEQGESLMAAPGGAERAPGGGVRAHRCWCPPPAARQGWWESSAQGPPGWFPAAASACVSPPPWR